MTEQFTHSVPASVDSHAHQKAEGILERRQRGILGLLAEAGPMGRTSLEIEKATNEGHGKVSGALSAMHREGQVVALKLDRRNGYGVYVLPGNVLNRLTRDYQSNGTAHEAIVPVSAPPRARLTSDELDLVARIRSGVVRDQAITRIQTKSLLALVEALTRLNA